MLTTEENELLTRVEGTAPMGQMMRRHWTPACMTEEVARAGGAPRRVRLFGEDLVAFRGADGKVAILGEHCPHRLASLALARVEGSALVCLYHGWKVDGAGRVLEMPAEPVESSRKDRIKHLSYPVHDDGSMIWIYMGPQGAGHSVPEFPTPPWCDKPGNSVAIAKIHQASNWAQGVEGTIDSSHSSTLHSSQIVASSTVKGSTDSGDRKEFRIARPSADRSPRLEVQYTSYGFRYAALRKPFENPETTDYVRITAYVAPYISLIPSAQQFRSAQIFVPVDDRNSIFYFVIWSDTMRFDQAGWQAENFAKVGVDVDKYHRKIRNRDNDYLQDREAMQRGDFTGILGVPNQDMAMEETMGAIVERSKENLGASDLAIVRFRQLMLHAVREFMQGKPAIGTAEPRLPLTAIRAYDALISKTTSWRTLAVTEQELAGYRTLAGSAARIGEAA